MLVQDRIDGRKVVALVETIVPVELVPRTMERVRARLGEDVDDTAPRAAGFGQIQVRLDPDFLNGVHRRLDADRADVALVVVHAVDQVVVPSAVAAVDRHRRGLPAIVVISPWSPVRRRRPWHHRHQVDEVAAGDRQILDRLFGDQRSQRRGIRLQERGLSRDLHGLGDHPDVQPPVDASAVAAREDGARAVRGEALAARSSPYRCRSAAA